ncbi:hypothetical protein MYX04_10875 [Nitrospiraceae bacterium AH_259_D15_M11_P09]|nr:hypothetical protein [Nitrospiraceae bacterium AH_259_D15_M11_P09]
MPPMSFVAKLTLGICIVSAFLLYGTGHPYLFGLAIANAIANFWSTGVMDNFAREYYTRIGADNPDIVPSWMERTLEGLAADYVPNWLASLNMGTAVIGLALLVYGIVINIKVSG